MKVIKRNGEIEDFDVEKIKQTIARVSDELKQPLTRGDLDYIGDRVKNTVFKQFQKEISSKDIHYILLEHLRVIGFTDIAKAYDEHEHSNA